MTESLVLQIQRLGGFNEQTLVMLHVAELRESSNPVSPGRVADLFRTLRLPPPRNERQHLVELRKRSFAMQPNPGEWSTTPLGRDEIARLMGEISQDELLRIGEGAPEPVFAGGAYHLLPAELAPVQFQSGVVKLLDQTDFDRNVFCITRYPRIDEDPIAPTVVTCRGVCAEFGLELHLASDAALDDMLPINVGCYMWGCRYAIVVLEDRFKEGLNYNVMFESGTMLGTGRRCLLLRDRTVPDLPTDLVGRMYKSVDMDHQDSVAVAVRQWIQDDLGLR